MPEIESAVARRQSLPPDLKIGWLSLWFGQSARRTWLDMAVRAGEGWDMVADVHGPLVQRKDLAPFVGEMRRFAAEEVDEARLASSGGALRIMLKRSHGWTRAEVGLNRGHLSQTISFNLWQQSLDEAVPAAEATLARLEQANRGWRPKWLFGKPDAAGPARAIESDEAPDMPERTVEAWESGIRTGDVSFRYMVDGFGWYAVDVRIGDACGEFGGGYLTDAMGDMLRSALTILAGGRRAEFVCHAEPGLTRVTFERVLLNVESGPMETAVRNEGCRVEIREIDHHSGEEEPAQFDACCHSPMALAEAVYTMACAHFADGTQPTSPAALAALEGALIAVREMEVADQASGTP